ncbi:TPA: cytochrome C oxidase subunit II [Candidatus Woesearchaeota archaeon]|nr:cupredoxin domain-containing protein [Candidatus Woesearchaeota archaeon]HIH39870.1 cytochrome C oxidase subunit II [Candidatus Woesearchaeota archaeon]
MKRLLFLLTVLILAACSSQTNTPATTYAVKDVSSVKEFTMTAKNWEFEPSTITVNQGDAVKLTVKSVDVEHSFALPDYSINVNLQPGVEETIEFVADKKGEFTFKCSVYCGAGHREMKGTLIVK